MDAVGHQDLVVPHDVDRRSLLIIGAGYAGLQFFLESLQRTIAQKIQDSVRYIFVDKRPKDQYGRGVAWASDQNPHMRTNMHIPEIMADQSTGVSVADILGVSYDRQPTASELFAKRETVGGLFYDQFQALLARAQAEKIDVHCVEDEVVDIERVGISYKAKLISGRTLDAHTVILALGHISPTTYPHLFDCPRYIRNPWAKADEVDAIEPEANVAVLGLGPTAVDTIIKLRDGGVRVVTAYSRSGSMQYPRPRPIKFKARIVTEKNLLKVARESGPLRTEVLKGLLIAEFLVQGVDWLPFLDAIKTANGPPLAALRQGYANCDNVASWFGLATSMTDAIPTAWHLLDDRDRPQFKALHREVSNVLYGMAPSHALRMLAELDDRTLRIHEGLESVKHDPVTGMFELTCSSKNERKAHQARYVIDCTGFGTDINLSATPLIINLIARGYLRPYKYGGAVVDFDSGQVAKSTKGRTLQIYCLTGSLNIGRRFVTNGLGEVSRSAQRTARAIHAGLEEEAAPAD